MEQRTCCGWRGSRGRHSTARSRNLVASSCQGQGTDAAPPPCQVSQCSFIFCRSQGSQSSFVVPRLVLQEVHVRAWPWRAPLGKRSRPGRQMREAGNKIMSTSSCRCCPRAGLGAGDPRSVGPRRVYLLISCLRYLFFLSLTSTSAPSPWRRGVWRGVVASARLKRWRSELKGRGDLFMLIASSCRRTQGAIVCVEAPRTLLRHHGKELHALEHENKPRIG